MASTFQPYVPNEKILPEFTFRAITLGALFGIIFGAVTVYLALRAGLTVSASIPIAVLAISLLKRFGSSILENNIVQTAGSAGESIAAGVAFTLPALIFLGFQLEVSRIFVIALAGGVLGVLFMIPLRRYLIVKEHGTLAYPEGTACADVLIAGEKGGRFAGRLFTGFGVGAVYKFLHEGFRLWKGEPELMPSWYPGARLAGTTTPEYMGVGFIIGPKVAGTIFAGGVLSWLVMIPLIKFFGSQLDNPIFPGTVPIAEMTPQQLWRSYIRPIGAGAVTMAGLFTLARTIPTITEAIRAGLRDMGAIRAGTAAARARTEDDLPLTIVGSGSLVLVVALWILLSLSINPGHWVANLVAAVLIVLFGFLFVTVSSRVVGLIGSSANPISGMTIATLMATCLIFVLIGWTGGAWAAVALSVGAVVCVAAANAGNTSQDLKTGFLVGATPRLQQIALVIGVLFSVAIIGYTTTYLNRSYTTVEPRTFENVSLGGEGMRELGTVEHQGARYAVVNVIGSQTIPDGRYYYDAAARRLAFEERPGIGSTNLPAPQATLMATVINGILNRNLPWRLVLFGAFVVICIELLGVRSLAFAVGSYLPIGTTAAIFGGGVVRWLVDRALGETAGGHGHGESEVSSGSLVAAGLIAGGAIAGLGVAYVDGQVRSGFTGTGPAPLDFGARWWPGLAASDLVALLLFVALGIFLYVIGRKRLET
jgi:putative OPT family oligopeptide transporter